MGQDARNSSVQAFREHTACLLYLKSPREGGREQKRKEGKQTIKNVDCSGHTDLGLVVAF